MSLGPLPVLLAALGRRARLLELTDEERGACYRTIALDYLRRAGIRRDRQPPPPGVALVPAAGLRVDVVEVGDTWAYDLRPVAAWPERSHDNPNHHSMDKTPEFETAIFSDYAFIGWVWTCTFHGQPVVGPGDRSAGPVCPPEFLWLGDTALGWRWDAALRKGWSMLGDDAREFATEHLLPLCTEHLRGMLLGTTQSKG